MTDIYESFLSCRLQPVDVHDEDNPVLTILREIISSLEHLLRFDSHF